VPEGFLFMDMDTISSALQTAFRTALLLEASTKIAEAAVLDGIAACEDLSHRSLPAPFFPSFHDCRTICRVRGILRASD
jgi:hypothetical protein